MSKKQEKQVLNLIGIISTGLNESISIEALSFLSSQSDRILGVK